MKMPRKLISALLASALIMGMTGCGQTGTSGGNEAPSVTTEDPDKQYDITSDYKEIAGSLDEVESKNEEGAGDLYESGKKAGGD